jgi:hypothetical protein
VLFLLGLELADAAMQVRSAAERLSSTFGIALASAERRALELLGGLPAQQRDLDVGRQLSDYGAHAGATATVVQRRALPGTR